MKKNLTKLALMGGMAAMAFAGVASAATTTVYVDNAIATSTTWTADKEYNIRGNGNIRGQVYVLPGASLTIEAGTLCRNDGGSLVIPRGAKIYAMGTKTKPIIMTGTGDNLTTWRKTSLEWGNLTMLGNAVIGAAYEAKAPYVRPGTGGVTNTKTPNAANVRQMEGLLPLVAADPNVMYGGGDDNDSSGELHYVSIRYGGKVIGANNELNGLSLGGIGRETQIDHIETMNAVDDAIETWGGTVNFKYVTTWNCGDDSFDVDQGWRGKAQFLCLVQGASLGVAGPQGTYQGGGFGDNIFEIDGAEDSDSQPVTTAVFYNVTAIGQPTSGDTCMELRDGARVQFRNSIFMDVGEVLMLAKTDGDNATAGYGLNGTLTYAQTFTTPWNVTSLINAYTGTDTRLNAAALYKAQTSGYLNEVSDCVFYNNTFATAYTQSDALGITTPSNIYHNVVAGSLPIKSITRATPTTILSMTLQQVTALDPRAANDAVTSYATAPNDGFFTPVQYRGAFSKDQNWMRGWTAADAYGFLTGANDNTTETYVLDLTPSTFFPTTAGVVYTVECSTDMKNWSPLATVVGDGTIKSYTDTTAIASTKKFYRAIVQ